MARVQLQETEEMQLFAQLEQAVEEEDSRQLPMEAQELLSEPWVAAELDALWARYAHAGRLGASSAINFIQFVRLTKETGIYPLRVQMEGLRQIFSGNTGTQTKMKMSANRGQEVTPDTWHFTFWSLCQLAYGDAPSFDPASCVIQFLEQIRAQRNDSEPQPAARLVAAAAVAGGGAEPDLSEPLELARWLMRKADRICHNGQLSVNELQTFLPSHPFVVWLFTKGSQHRSRMLEYDYDGDGGINLDELTKACNDFILEQVAPSGNRASSPVAQKSQANSQRNAVEGMAGRWRSLCAHQREQLSDMRQSVEQARSARQVPSAEEVRVRREAEKVFGEADRHGDGMLTHTELKKRLKGNKTLKAREAKAFFEELGADDDGKVSREAFVKLFVERCSKVSTDEDVLAVPSALTPVDKPLRKVLLQLEMKDKALSKPDMSERSRNARLKERHEIVKLLHRLGHVTQEAEPSLCHMRALPGLFGAFVGHCCTLGVVLYDATGELCTVADESVVAASSSDGWECHLAQTGVGECRVVFAPEVANLEQTVNVTVAGVPVCGSPFSVPVVTPLPGLIKVKGGDCVSGVAWSVHSCLCEDDAEEATLSACEIMRLENGGWDVRHSSAAEVDGGCLVQFQYKGGEETFHWFYCDTDNLPDEFTIDATADHSNSFRWSPLGPSPSQLNSPTSDDMFDDFDEL